TGVPARSLPESPFVIDTAEQGQVRVTVVEGLELPWDMAFLPNGDILVTERPSARLRIVRAGRLVDPEPVANMPDLGGELMGLAVHPRFAENGWIYFAYTKPTQRGRRGVGLSRARLEGHALHDVRELFSAEEQGGGP